MNFLSSVLANDAVGNLLFLWQGLRTAHVRAQNGPTHWRDSNTFALTDQQDPGRAKDRPYFPPTDGSRKSVGSRLSLLIDWRLSVPGECVTQHHLTFWMRCQKQRTLLSRQQNRRSTPYYSSYSYYYSTSISVVFGQ